MLLFNPVAARPCLGLPSGAVSLDGRYGSMVAALQQINPIVSSVELNDIRQPSHVVVGHKFNGKTLPLQLSQESAGFRRFYAHLLALYQRPSKQMLLFEHPEDGIHPGVLSLLAEEFNAASADRRGQVILTTHSPDFLDHFAAEQIRVVELDGLQTRIGPVSDEQREAVQPRRTASRRSCKDSTGGDGSMKRIVLFAEAHVATPMLTETAKRRLRKLTVSMRSGILRKWRSARSGHDAARLPPNRGKDLWIDALTFPLLAKGTLARERLCLMKTIQTKQTVSSDGRIHLDIPVGCAGDQVDVLVVLSRPEPIVAPDWPEFVEQMAGSCPDLHAPDDPPPNPLREVM